MKIKKKYLAWICLALLFLFHAVNNIDYMIKDTRPPAWDQSWHSAISLSHYNSFTGKGRRGLRKNFMVSS